MKPRATAWTIFSLALLASSGLSAEVSSSAVPPSENPSHRSSLDEKWAVGAWIWCGQTTDKQTCNLWRAIEIPDTSPVVKAQLRITADNGFKVMLDGRELGRGSDWRSLSDFDLSWLLPPGLHVLAVEGFNDSSKAGVLVGLRIQLKNGEVLEVPSDARWRVAPLNTPGWEKRTRAREDWPAATVVGQFLAPPWSGPPFSVTLVPPMKPLPFRFWQTAWFQIGMGTLCAVALILCGRLLAKLAVQSRARQLLQRERVRIARDIHDDLGAGLTQLVLMGELAQNEAAQGSERQAQMEQFCEKARALLGTMDEIVWAVNSRRDSVREFATHACKYAQGYVANTAIRCRMDIDAELPDEQMDLPLRRNLFLAYKEAFRNAARHSGAVEIFLKIYYREDALVVTVEDTGKGFSLEQAQKEKSDRNGLLNMKRRMQEMGGTFEVKSGPGQGCRVTLSLPLRARRSLLGWFQRRFRPRDAMDAGLHSADLRSAA